MPSGFFLARSGWADSARMVRSEAQSGKSSLWEARQSTIFPGVGGHVKVQESGRRKCQTLAAAGAVGRLHQSLLLDCRRCATSATTSLRPETELGVPFGEPPKTPDEDGGAALPALVAGGDPG